MAASVGGGGGLGWGGVGEGVCVERALAVSRCVALQGVVSGGGKRVCTHVHAKANKNMNTKAIYEYETEYECVTDLNSV